MKTFTKRPFEDGKTCFEVKDHSGFRGYVRYFAATKEWAYLAYPSGRIFRFDTLKDAKEEALKA